MTPQRREPGIRRRLRLWFVRETLFEKKHPRPGRITTYGRPWNNPNELTKFSFSCDQHPVCLIARAESRYSRADRRRAKAVPA